jgi:hypothetical protein
MSFERSFTGGPLDGTSEEVADIDADHRVLTVLGNEAGHYQSVDGVQWTWMNDGLPLVFPHAEGVELTGIDPDDDPNA